MTTGIELGRPIEILLVEDSPTDAQLAIEALRTNGIENRIHHVEDGEEAMEFLRREGRFSLAPRPDLILLDLNLPKRDGRAVLTEIRRDEDLRSLLVVVLTTSADERDILASYGLNANLYITKPVDFEKFLEVVKAVKSFCLTVIAIPSVP